MTAAELIAKLRRGPEEAAALHRAAAAPRGATRVGAAVLGPTRRADVGARARARSGSRVDRRVVGCAYASARARADGRQQLRLRSAPAIVCASSRPRLTPYAIALTFSDQGPSISASKSTGSADYKTGIRWAPAYCRDIAYSNFNDPIDVKFPWEVSRMQWMIPLGQAYVLTGDESYARSAKELIASWIRENPYARSVNWACTMDVALRVLSWTWFFHAFAQSAAWRDREFRGALLRALYLHGDFIGRNLEKSDINGNHYTADAAGLVFAGLFFGVDRWSANGWAILSEQLPLQVFPDGVDFEASRFRITVSFTSSSCSRRSIGAGMAWRSPQRIGSGWSRWRGSPKPTRAPTAACLCGAMPTMGARCHSAASPSTTIAT